MGSEEALEGDGRVVSGVEAADEEVNSSRGGLDVQDPPFRTLLSD